MSDLVGNPEDHFSHIAAMNENCTAIANLINMDFLGDLQNYKELQNLE